MDRDRTKAPIQAPKSGQGEWAREADTLRLLATERERTSRLAAKVRTLEMELSAYRHGTDI